MGMAGEDDGRTLVCVAFTSCLGDSYRRTLPIRALTLFLSKLPAEVYVPESYACVQLPTYLVCT